MSNFIDITGQIFGDWVVLERVANNKRGAAMFKCKCICGNIRTVNSGNLRNGLSTCCGCRNKPGIDETGNTYGMLYVVKRNPSREKEYQSHWICRCECGNKVSLLGQRLRNGGARHCGCIDYVDSIKRDSNTYIEKDDCFIGITNKGEEFYFDKEDYDKVRGFCWSLDSDGYVITRYDSKTRRMHRYVSGIEDKPSEIVDHIDRNPQNNRKSNLRSASRSQNSWNIGLRSNNTSGVTGVNKESDSGKWRAVLNRKGIRYSLGRYDKFEDAVVARLEGEQKYFGEFAPQQHLYEKYFN